MSTITRAALYALVWAQPMTALAPTYVLRLQPQFRDVEELMAQRGIEVTYETIRCWTIKFGPLIARRLKKRRWPPTGWWHLDEMICRIGGRRMYLWRAIDDEGEVLDVVVQHRPGRLRDHNRVESSHLPIGRRERQKQRFKSQAANSD